MLKKTVLILLLVTTLNLQASKIETSGDILKILLPAVAFSSTYYFNDTKEGRYQLYKSIFANIGLTYALKYTTDKTRPNGEKYSFPSGHTSLAFGSSAFIDRRYGFKYAMLPYLASIYTGYTRVQSKNHYTIDVIAGAILGIASSYIFTNECKKCNINASYSDNKYHLLFKTTW